jgi:hypothetical protein
MGQIRITGIDEIPCAMRGAAAAKAMFYRRSLVE